MEHFASVAVDYRIFQVVVVVAAGDDAIDFSQNGRLLFARVFDGYKMVSPFNSKLPTLPPVDALCSNRISTKTSSGGGGEFVLRRDAGQVGADLHPFAQDSRVIALLENGLVVVDVVPAVQDAVDSNNVENSSSRKWTSSLSTFISMVVSPLVPSSKSMTDTTTTTDPF